ncbi:peptidoglycan recognition protein 3 [Anabrus simplex]|uniref:peptidoglycan recognition protein 3 n=1 Tax=Anabrus simplex TaxID=316456 RepID=UPI0035A38ACE
MDHTTSLTAALTAFAVFMTATGECPEIVTKAGWNAGPVTVRENLTVPVPYVVIHHTYIPGPCNNTEDCSRSMRAMQTYHQGKGWNDIGYSFVIGGDNKVYEGRGWDIVGAHSPKYNFMSIGISFIGDYRSVLPSEEMLNLSKSLIECGIARGSIQADYKLLGHRQVRSTECPGDALYNHIQTWPHWNPMIDIVPRDSNQTSDVNVLINIINANIPPENAIFREAGCPDIVTKAGWNASPVTVKKNLTVPVPYVIIHHTYIPGPCNNTEDCSRSMRAMQSFHQGKKWDDIGYSFCIGGDNKIYEGRGWDTVGVHSPRYNSISIGICFIGDYRTELPSEEMLNLAQSLIECGIARGSIRSDYKLLGHRQVRSTECPGEALFNHIQTWSHWDPMIDIVSSVLDNSSSTPQLDSSTLLSITNVNITASSEGTNTYINADAVTSHQVACPQTVTREDWNAAPVTGRQNLTLPVPYIVIHHTLIPGACNNTADCSSSMRSMQRYHQHEGWGDIGYNFVIGGDNKVYEGRGWDTLGTHSSKYNSRSIGIAFIGDYRNELPSEEMLNALKSLIGCGVARGSVKSDYKLIGHGNVEALHKHLQTWPHWDTTHNIVARSLEDSTSSSPVQTSPQYDSITAYTTERAPSEEGVCPDIVTKEGWNAAPVRSR